MNRIAIATDSNSGITQARAKELGVFVFPMPFYIDGEVFLEDITLTQEQFYESLQRDCEIKTSQPVVGDLLKFWDDILEEYDEIIYVPMSSGLSGACASAQMLAEDYNGRVHVVDNQRISITMRDSVTDAKALVEKGFDAKTIVDIMMRDKMKSGIYIMVDNLKYLKKGGRLTPAAAAIGTFLNIKPVLRIDGGKLDAFAKVRGAKQAHKVMIDALKKDLETRVSADRIRINVAHTVNMEDAELLRQEILEVLPGLQIDIDPLSLSVSCHIGPGAFAFGWEELTEELL